MNRNHKIIIVLLLIIIIGGIITYINLSADKVNADGTIKVGWLNKQKVIKIAKEEVLNNLKTPSTAIFPKDKDIIVFCDKNNKNHYTINLPVDAQNEYGAMIRKNVLMQIIFKPDKTYEIKGVVTY